MTNSGEARPDAEGASARAVGSDVAAPGSVSTDPTLTDRTAANASSRRRRRGIAVAMVAVVVVAAVIVAVSIGAGAASAPPKAKLRVALQLFPDNLDIRNTAGAALEQTLIGNVYQGLTARDAKGEVSPSLATSWTVSDDKKTYTFELAKGARFSNGDPLTSADVVYSLRDVATGERQSAATLAAIDTVTAKGEGTVVIALKQPDPALLYSLAGRAGLIVDKGQDSPKTTSVGSGPFRVTRFSAGSSMTLTRDPDYWGEKAQVETVTFTVFSDVNAIVNAVLAGTVDLGGIDATLAPKVRADEDFTVKTGFASDKYTLAFNNRVAPFTDLRVRQAIRSAIDHDAIVEAVGSGRTLYGPIVASDPGYEDLSALYPHDPAKARQLLAEAGYPDGLDLTLTIPSFYGSTLPDLLVSQLAEAGIRLKVDSVEFSAWLDQVYTKHDYQLSVVDHAEARDLGNWANPDYYFGYDDPEVQRLYASATSATSEKEYARELREAARIVSTDAAGDWLYNASYPIAVRKGVTGVSIDSFSSRVDVTRARVAD